MPANRVRGKTPDREVPRRRRRQSRPRYRQQKWVRKEDHIPIWLAAPARVVLTPGPKTAEAGDLGWDGEQKKMYTHKIWKKLAHGMSREDREEYAKHTVLVERQIERQKQEARHNYQERIKVEDRGELVRPLACSAARLADADAIDEAGQDYESAFQ